MQIQYKQQELLNGQRELEETNDRISAIDEHLKNVKQELEFTQVGKVKNPSPSIILPHATYVRT